MSAAEVFTAVSEACGFVAPGGGDPCDRTFEGRDDIHAARRLQGHRLRHTQLLGGRDTAPADNDLPAVAPGGHPEEQMPGGGRAATRMGGAKVRSITDRVRRQTRRKPKPDKPDKPDKPSPAPAPSRHSLARGASSLYARVGKTLEGSRRRDLVPAGRAAQLFAPAAGAHWDTVLAGTWVDRRLQPFVGKSEAWKAIGASIGFPGIVYALTIHPEWWEMLAPELEEMVESNILSMGPVMRADAKRKREVQKTLDEMAANGIVAEGATVRDIIEALFRPVPADEPAPAPAPQPAAGPVAVSVA